MPSVRWLRFALVALLLAGTGQRLSAQIVRGIARERASGTPIPGVLVTLERADAATGTTAAVERSVLTNAQGGYVLRAAGPGQYRVGAKRIGVQRYQSEVFTLGPGESRVVELELDAVVHTLDQVVVEREALCVIHRGEARRVAAMWDEIQTALAAATISARDSLFSGRLTRYARLLDPGTLRLRREAREEAEGLMVRPFRSPGGDSLSELGYWRRMPGDTLAFFGPDTDVLLTETFRRDHCFSVAGGRRDRPGMVGLAFVPAPGRKVPDIEGAIWLDERTLELRLAEFRYTGLARIEHVERIGGEVEYARLPNGAWIVDRWYIRMPRFGYASWREGSRATVYSAQGFQLPRIDEILEEGGEASATNLREAVGGGVILGTVSDSTGAPLRSATVRLVGTDFATSVDITGSYRLDGLPAGRYLVAADHAGYARFGVPAAEWELELAAEAPARVDLQARKIAGVVTRLCAGRPPEQGRATARLTFLDSLTGEPIAGAMVRVQWTEYESAAAGGVAVRRVRPAAVHGTTDAAGAVLFCAIPAGITLELGWPLGENGLRRVSVLRARPNSITTATFRTTRRR